MVNWGCLIIPSRASERVSRQKEVNIVMSTQLMYPNQDIPKEPEGALNFLNCLLKGKGWRGLE